MNKREFLKILGTGAIAFPVAAITARTVPQDINNHFRNDKREETAFERIQRTGIIRCAYSAYAPTIIVDPITRQTSGIFYELTRAC